MRVMVVIKANQDSENGMMPSERVIQEMVVFNEELVKAGILLAADGLRPSSQAKRILFDAKGTSVVDGPFAETKELIAGFWIWKVASMEEAVAWARRIPNPEGSDSIVDLRPIGEMEDFGEKLTPELRERGLKTREEGERRGRNS